MLGRMFCPKNEKVEMSLLMMSFKTFTLNLLCFGWNKEYTTGCNIEHLWKKIKIFSEF